MEVSDAAGSCESARRKKQWEGRQRGFIVSFRWYNGSMASNASLCARVYVHAPID